MGRKYKITKQLLSEIKDTAFDRISIEDVCDKLNFSYKLLDNKKVIKAYEDGQIEHFVYMVGDGGFKYEEIVRCHPYISMEQCELWGDIYYDEIKILVDKKAKQTTRQFSGVMTCGISNIVQQSEKNADELSNEIIVNDIKSMVKKIQNGDTTDMITIIASSTIQLQMLNKKIATNISGKVGKSLVNLDVLSKIQLKTISELRKNVVAMNEICNPKKTTFIKEAHQHNNLKVNQEKIEKKNELQTNSQLLENKCIEDAEILPTKEKVKC